MTRSLDFVVGTVVALAIVFVMAGCTEEQADPVVDRTVKKAGSAVAATTADSAKGGTQAKCPVMGGNIVKTIFADHDGKRVYFCCKGCDGPFKKDPAKYIKKLEDAGVTLATAPAPKGE